MAQKKRSPKGPPECIYAAGCAVEFVSVPVGVELVGVEVGGEEGGGAVLEEGGAGSAGITSVYCAPHTEH